MIPGNIPHWLTGESEDALVLRCVVRPVVCAERTSSALQQLAAHGRLHVLFQTFDASQAACFKTVDKHRLLGVIESTYGSLQVFNIAAVLYSLVD